MAKEYRIYRASNSNAGAASSWQFRIEKGEKFDKHLFFLVIAPQDGTNENGDAKFLWKDESITVKLGEADLGEIICVLSGVKDSLGFKGSLFHASPNGQNKVINLNRNEKGGFYLQVSQQNEDKTSKKFQHSISDGEATILLILLRRGVETAFSW